MASVDMCEHDWPGSGCPECKASASLASDASPNGEPVAWVQPGYLSMLQKYGSCSMRFEPIEALDYVVPLYAHPAPATPATSAETGASVGVKELPYQVLFNAIAAATDIAAGGLAVSISVEKFRSALASATDAEGRA